MFIKPSSQTIQLQQFNSTNVQSRSGRAQPTLFCKANPPPCALFIKSQQKVMHSPGVSASCVSSLHDPITWSEEERVAEYRVLAARYRQMADTEARVLVRDGLLELAGHCEAAITSNRR